LKGNKEERKGKGKEKEKKRRENIEKSEVSTFTNGYYKSERKLLLLLFLGLDATIFTQIPLSLEITVVIKDSEGISDA
jgi:hypothetical protein